MKNRVLLIGILLICIKAKATPYYFSTSGSDVNTGANSANPFKTITKLNTLILKPGDSIFFKCGDIFRGQINVNNSGTSSLPIVFASYGSGAKPVISGAEQITGWSVNGSVYQATFTQDMNNFFVNDKEQVLARYPNDHQYLTVDSAQVSYLKDASITSISPAMVSNSKICVHTRQWCWEKTGVQSVTGDKITYSSDVTLAANAEFGYFLYDNILHLDTAKEWKYDNTAKLITYMPPSGQNPNLQTCEGAVYANGILVGSTSSYITIKGLSFEKQSSSGVAISGANNRYIKIDSCYFARQYNHGVNDNGKYNEISNSYFREIDGIAVMVKGSGSNSTIHHNIFRNIGEFRNSGIGTQLNLSAITAAFVDSCYIHHNDIDSTGYCGISADGKYHLVEKNIIKNAMLLNNDGGALKTYGSLSSYVTFKNNFINTCNGNTEGIYNTSINPFPTPAIYFDHESNNSLAQDNTIYNCTQRGIIQNSGTQNNTIRGNTIYGFNYGIDLFSTYQPEFPSLLPIKGMIVKDNRLFALNSSSFPIRQADFSTTFNQGVIDSNYYFQPYSNIYAIRSPGSLYTFPQWQSTGNDTHTIVDNFKWTAGVDSSKIFLNPTDNAVTQDLLGWKWKELDGNIVTTLTLQPWTSKIMIRTNVPNVNVTVNSVTKCANDAAVTITATPLQSGTYNYVWTVPAGATNPGNVQSFSASVAGTYTVTITDKTSGGTGSGSATLTISASPSVPTVSAGGPTTFCSGGSVVLTSTSGTANQWYKDGIAITGATNATYTATAAGSYTDTVTNTGGCKAGSAITKIASVVVPTPTISQQGDTLISSAASGNQWYLNNTTLTGAVNQKYKILNTGTYTVKVTDANGCISAISANFPVVITAVNTVSVNSPDWKLYPNPVEVGKLYIQRAGVYITDNVKAQIVTQDGRIVAERSIGSNSEWNISVLAKGTYYLRILEKKSTSVYKIIKQ